MPAVRLDIFTVPAMLVYPLDRITRAHWVAYGRASGVVDDVVHVISRAQRSAVKLGTARRAYRGGVEYQPVAHVSNAAVGVEGVDFGGREDAVVDADVLQYSVY